MTGNILLLKKNEFSIMDGNEHLLGLLNENKSLLCRT